MITDNFSSKRNFMKVLVVDDEDIMRTLIRESLECDGHKVTEAANGILALKEIQANRPDLVISDVRMPEMDGDEFFKTLRVGETNLNLIPFIFLTADTSDNEIVERLNSGASHCIRKPVSMYMLRAHVKSCESNLENFSHFMSRKLDDIADVLPHSISRSFDHFNSLIENLDLYARDVQSLLKSYAQSLESHAPDLPLDADGSEGASPDETGYEENRLQFIRLFLKELETRQRLVERQGNGTITWHLIYLVAESNLLQKDLYVSDLYVAVNAAKTTINKHINDLLDDDIFVKHGDVIDGRRKRITLSRSFADNVYTHIDEFSRLASACFCDPRQSAN